MQASEKKTRWQEKREASFDALVRSAMHRFNERGYAATRIEDIVEGTGYTSGAFYFHFKNKADCFWHVVEHRQRLRGEWSRVTAGLDPAATPLAEILRRVFGHFDTAVVGRLNWHLAIVDFFNQHRGDLDTQTRFAAAYKTWHTEIERFVIALQDGGWIDRDRDADLLATQLFAATDGLRTHAALYSFDAERFHRALIDMHVRILKDEL